MSTKYRTAIVLLFMAIICIIVGLSVPLFSAVINVILFLVGVIALFLAIAVLIFAKKTDKKVSKVLSAAIEALLNFGF